MESNLESVKSFKTILLIGFIDQLFDLMFPGCVLFCRLFPA